MVGVGLGVGDSVRITISGTALASTPAYPSFTRRSVINPEATESSTLDSKEALSLLEDLTVYTTVTAVPEDDALSTNVTITSDGGAPVISATASRKEFWKAALEASARDSPAITLETDKESEKYPISETAFITYRVVSYRFVSFSVDSFDNITRHRTSNRS